MQGVHVRVANIEGQDRLITVLPYIEPQPHERTFRYQFGDRPLRDSVSVEELAELD